MKKRKELESFEPAPSLALLVFFGIGTSKALRRFLALGQEIRNLETELEEPHKADEWPY
jgi:hypothetical protein